MLQTLPLLILKPPVLGSVLQLSLYMWWMEIPKITN